MKKYFLIFFVFLFLISYAIFKVGRPKVTTLENDLSVSKIFDLEGHDVWWLILDDSQIEISGWLIHNHPILFLDNGGISFLDNEDTTVILYNRFICRLVKFDNWIHADFRDFFEEFVDGVEPIPKQKPSSIKPLNAPKPLKPLRPSSPIRLPKNTPEKKLCYFQKFF